jgi:hydroxyacylglutathione hydrolase
LAVAVHLGFALEDAMILRSFLHFDPVAISYLFGCGGQSMAAVVDPVGDVAPYLQAAAETGMAIRYVIDTHIHADHVSAGRFLAEATATSWNWAMWWPR